MTITLRRILLLLLLALPAWTAESSDNPCTCSTWTCEREPLITDVAIAAGAPDDMCPGESWNVQVDYRTVEGEKKCVFTSTDPNKDCTDETLPVPASPKWTWSISDGTSGDGTSAPAIANPDTCDDLTISFVGEITGVEPCKGSTGYATGHYIDVAKPDPSLTGVSDFGTICPGESKAKTWNLTEGCDSACTMNYTIVALPSDPIEDLFNDDPSVSVEFEPSSIAIQGGQTLPITVTASVLPGSKRGKVTKHFLLVPEQCLSAVGTTSFSITVSVPEILVGVDPPMLHACPVDPQNHIAQIIANNQGDCDEDVVWRFTTADGARAAIVPAAGGGTLAPKEVKPWNVQAVLVPDDPLNPNPNPVPDFEIANFYYTVSGGAERGPIPVVVTIGKLTWDSVFMPWLRIAGKSPRDTLQIQDAGRGQFTVQAQLWPGLKWQQCNICKHHNLNFGAIGAKIDKYTWNGGGGNILIDAGASATIDFPKVGRYRPSVAVHAISTDPDFPAWQDTKTATYSVWVDAWKLIRKPTLIWKRQPKLDPNPANPGELVKATAEPKSAPGSKRIFNIVADIPVSEATWSFKLPETKDLSLTVDGLIAVGGNAKGKYPIEFTANAVIPDPADKALCGGDLELKTTVPLEVPPPKARVTIEDGEALSNSALSLEWSITNTGEAPDTFQFTFEPMPKFGGGPVVAAASRAGSPIQALAVQALAAPLPSAFSLEIRGWSYEVIGVPGSGQNTRDATGTVHLQPNQTARGLVHVQVHGGKQGDTGTVSLKVASRGMDLDSAVGRVKVGNYLIDMSATDVVLTKANTVDTSRFKIAIVDGPAKPKSVTVTMTIEPPEKQKDALQLRWKEGGKLTLSRAIVVKSKEPVGLVIEVSAADLSVIPNLDTGEEGLKVTISVTIDGETGSEKCTFRVWRSDKNKLILEPREKPYVYAGEIGILDVRAIAGDPDHRARNVNLTAANAEMSEDLKKWANKLSLSIGQDRESVKSWKVYYRYKPDVGAKPLEKITFSAEWLGTTKTKEQEVKAFKLKAIDPEAVRADMGTTATSALIDKRDGADIRWKIRLDNDKLAMADGQAMASIDEKEGKIRLLLDKGRSAAAYTVTAQLFKDMDDGKGVVDIHVNDSALFKAVFGTFEGVEPLQCNGVYPEDKAIVVETGKSKEFVITLFGKGRTKVAITPEDLELVDAKTGNKVQGPFEAPCTMNVAVKHTGRTGRENTPYGKLTLTLDEGERVEVLPIDIYVFDLLTLPVKPVLLTDAAGKDMSQSYDNWIKTVPDASYYWYRQAVIALSTEAPVRVPREMMRTLTPAHERTLQVQFDRLYRGNVVAFFTFELASEDALAKGATGARFMFFGLWAGNRSDQVLAHEVGHTLDLGNDGNHDGPVPHPPSALMNSGVGGVRLLLRDILAARPKVIEYIRGRP